ncbi:MAG: circularly permuted type 2 ATP-grasp protein [Erysipelotrichaceae bacterium]|nr:circularly permuted type 2 ATP-grasp protein [Erysipelotrichaceae bacterium]
MNYDDLLKNEKSMNEMLERYGVRFGIYKNNTFKEQLFPFDPIPRIITKEEFDYLEKGLIQRVDALNMFLKDVYTDYQIVKDGVIPEDFVFSSKGFLPECVDFVPINDIYAHIAGIDLVQGKDGKWYVLEDNLRIPSGASYPMIARTLERKISPKTFEDNEIVDNRNYAKMLKETMDYVNTGGINVILTPGRYNAAYFEHSYLAEQSGSVLAVPSELTVENATVYYRSADEEKIKVGAIYRRVSDEYLDPLTFVPESLIGVPSIMTAYRNHNVGLINGIGNGVADDKGIYYFVPKMIEYYLHEKPILNNAPTYLPFYEDDLNIVLENLPDLVVKDVSEAGGYGVVFGRDMDEEKLAEWRERLKKEPRRFIAQEVIDFIDLETNEGCRKADLRAFVLSGETTRVWASGLTRFSRNKDSFVVNSSQGGGFKDTWILSR